MAQGRFITLEGADGAGKTTQIMQLAQALRDYGHTVVQTREPGGTELSEKIRDLLLSQKMVSKTELLLFAAARAQHVEEVIKPALAAGKIVICDRFADSSYAYQGAGRGLTEDVLALERFTLNGFEPDYTLYLHISLEESMRRLGMRSEQQDRFDVEHRQFKRQVYKGYQRRFMENPHRMVKINAMQAPIDVWNDIHAWLIQVLLPEIASDHLAEQAEQRQTAI